MDDDRRCGILSCRTKKILICWILVETAFGGFQKGGGWSRLVGGLSKPDLERWKGDRYRFPFRFYFLLLFFCIFLLGGGELKWGLIFEKGSGQEADRIRTIPVFFLGGGGYLHVISFVYGDLFWGRLNEKMQSSRPFFLCLTLKTKEKKLWWWARLIFVAGVARALHVISFVCGVLFWGRLGEKLQSSRPFFLDQTKKTVVVGLAVFCCWGGERVKTRTQPYTVYWCDYFKRCHSREEPCREVRDDTAELSPITSHHTPRLPPDRKIRGVERSGLSLFFCCCCFTWMVALGSENTMFVERRW